jgi:hypothetical protein
VRGEPPIDPTLGGMALAFPSGSCLGQCGRSGHPPVYAWPGQDTACALGHVHPTPVLGRVMYVQPFHPSSSLSRSTCFIPGGRWVRGEVVQDQRAFLGLRLLPIDQGLEQMSTVSSRPPLRHLALPLTGQRLAHHQQRGRALPLVRLIATLWLPRRCWEGCAGGCHPWGTGLVQAPRGMPWLVGAGGHCQHVLQGTDNRSVGLGRAHTRVRLPGCERVFLRVVRTPSARIVSTISWATALSAQSWQGHRVLPAGGAPQVTAIHGASWTPSHCRYCRPGGGLRATAVSRPRRKENREPKTCQMSSGEALVL